MASATRGSFATPSRADAPVTPVAGQAAGRGVIRRPRTGVLAAPVAVQGPAGVPERVLVTHRVPAHRHPHERLEDVGSGGDLVGRPVPGLAQERALARASPAEELLLVAPRTAHRPHSLRRPSPDRMDP